MSSDLAQLRSTCKISVTYFPFDSQRCFMKFGVSLEPLMKFLTIFHAYCLQSWTYHGFQVDVTNRSLNVDLSNYVINGEFDLVNVYQVNDAIIRSFLFLNQFFLFNYSEAHCRQIRLLSWALPGRHILHSRPKVKPNHLIETFVMSLRKKRCFLCRKTLYYMYNVGKLNRVRVTLAILRANWFLQFSPVWWCRPWPYWFSACHLIPVKKSP